MNDVDGLLMHDKFREIAHAAVIILQENELYGEVGDCCILAQALGKIAPAIPIATERR